MNKRLIAAVIVVTIVPFVANPASAEHACLGNPTCNVTQNEWSTASEADKRTSAYPAALVAEQSQPSSAYWQVRETLASHAPAPTVSADR